MIIPNYFEDLKTLHINTLPRKNYYIPYDNPNNFKRLPNRSDSAYFHSLNGTWDFHYFNNVRSIDKAYWQDNTSLSYDKIPVPSCWQLHGYDQIMYSNTEFPIPFDPPYVPFDNPAGLYHRVIDLDKKEDKTYHLIFEGVDSAFYVWLNGEFVGYSQISHATHEFDIEPYLINGENHLHVLVLKWSDATYLEDQDKFRYSGIFRDVYYLERDKKRIEDFRITQQFNADLSHATINIKLNKTDADLPITVKLLAPDDQLLAEQTTLDQQIQLSVPQPQLWSAETPLLYSVILSTGNEYIQQLVGLRLIEMRDNQFWVNHRSVKLIGVNHHDTHPNTGATVTYEAQLRDLQLIKQFNFNALRTAHYPKTGEFYELTDALGLYVLSEADLEGHGVVDLYGLGGNANYNALAENPEFEQAFVDRMDASMQHHLNSTSIVMWSAGNETGYGPNVEAMFKYARSIDSSRPLHYEAYYYYDRNKTYDTQYMDSWSRMYASPTEIKADYLDIPNIEKPFMLCEYAHAMGNSSGDLLEYYELFQQYPEFIGLFVWEWADHAVNITRNQTDATPLYRYGGDFGEFPHAGNFCMDGLVYPDRKPHVLLQEHAQLYRPVRLVETNHLKHQYTFFNTLDFVHAETLLSLHVELYAINGHLLKTISTSLPSIAPKQSNVLDLSELLESELALSYIKFVYYDHDGNTRGFDVHHIAPIAVPEISAPQQAFTFNETSEVYSIESTNMIIHISKANAAIQNIWLNGEPQLVAPSKWSIWRAPTDNDRNIKAEWYKAHYHHAMTRIHHALAEETDAGYTISLKGVINAPARQTILDFEVDYTITNEGIITINGRTVFNPVMPYLPRFGLTLPLDVSYENVQYKGHGPFENYRDKHHASHEGYFEDTVTAMHEPYVTPQENGNRSNVQYLLLANTHHKLTVATNDTLNFNVQHYSMEQLTNVMHRDELQVEDVTYLQLDPQQSGIGTNSCGPELFEHYRLNHDFEFEFELWWQ
ncbi:glycoside hydrolase family 2 [Aerococcaceae bacterium zg-ZUI334]|uniref:glycoside hydrolase family 2 TIM barrel-domain containing protein n=1 Tax=Aerococcaceae bacterium zg-252 TaxID=2796928 RepID=UPI001B8F1A07|nr:glycoside hydrolase family 2 [Aerococcaceae bacterium zg-ZUI334]